MDKTIWERALYVGWHEVFALILKNFPIEPKISPHMHKDVLLKGIKVLIAKSIT